MNEDAGDPEAASSALLPKMMMGAIVAAIIAAIVSAICRLTKPAMGERCPACHKPIYEDGSIIEADGTNEGTLGNGDAVQAMPAVHLHRCTISEAPNHWAQTQGTVGVVIRNLQQIMRGQLKDMRTHRYMMTAVRREYRTEQGTMWMTSCVTEAADGALKHAVVLMDASLERMAAGANQYIAALASRVRKNPLHAAAEDTRTEMGNTLIRDINTLVRAIDELEGITRRNEGTDQTEVLRYLDERTRNWASLAMLFILNGEAEAATEAEFASVARKEGRGRFRQPHVSRTRAARLIRETAAAKTTQGMPRHAEADWIKKAVVEDSSSPSDEEPAHSPKDATAYRAAQSPSVIPTLQKVKKNLTFEDEEGDSHDETHLATSETFIKSETGDQEEIFSEPEDEEYHYEMAWDPASVELIGTVGTSPPAIETAIKPSTAGGARQQTPKAPGEHTTAAIVHQHQYSHETTAAPAAMQRREPQKPPRSRKQETTSTKTTSTTTLSPLPPLNALSTPGDTHVASVRKASLSANAASAKVANIIAARRSTSGDAKPGARAKLRQPHGTSASSSAVRNGSGGTVNKLALIIMALTVCGVDSAAISKNSLEAPATQSGAPDTQPRENVTEPFRADAAEADGGANENESTARPPQTPRRDDFTGTYFRAYDCRKLNSPKRRVIDITEVGDCPDSKRDYEEVRQVEAAMLQAPVPIRVNAFRCRAWFKKDLIHCGRWHIPYGRTAVETRRNLKFDKEDCSRMVREKRFWCPADLCFADPGQGLGRRELTVGQEAVFEWTSRGKRGDGGYCPEVTEYVYNERIWGKQMKGYETTTLHVLVEEIPAEYHRNTGKIDFPAINIVEKTYKDGEYFAGDAGSVFWNNGEHACTEEYNVITQTKVDLYMPRKHKADTDDPYRKAMVLLNDGKRVGGFTLQERENGCLKGCYRTQADRVLICLNEVSALIALDEVKKGKPDPQTRIGMQSVISYVVYEDGIFDDDKFELILDKMCVQSRGQWYGMMASSAHYNREITYLMRQIDREDPTSTLTTKGDVGYSVTPVGGALIIEECPAVTVRLTTYVNCTENIPAYVDEERVFVDPITYVIEDWPRVTLCNAAYPSHFKINGKWHCSDPTYSTCQMDPTKLAPDLSWESGVTIERVDQFRPKFYTDSDWEDAIKYRKVTGSREAVAAELRIERTAAGEAAAGGSLSYDYNGWSFKAALYEVYYDLTDPARVAVETFVFAMCALFAVSMLRTCCGNISRISYLTYKWGCGTWVATAMYNVFFNTISLPGKIMKTAYQRISDDIEMVTADADPANFNAQLRVLERRVDDLISQHARAKVEQVYADFEATIEADRKLRAAAEPVGGINAQFIALQQHAAKAAQGANKCFNYQETAFSNTGTEENESLVSENGHYDGSSSAPSRCLTPSPRNDSTDTAIIGQHYGERT